jgi:N4-gp56 family major capsid protein
MAPYMGTSDNAVIQIDKNFLKDQGDKITFALRKLLTGSGQTDDGTYDGNSEAMNFFNLDVVIHERGNSVALAGNMTEQSAYAKLRPKGRSAIREWVANIQTRDIIDALSGLKSTALFSGPDLGTLAVDASSNQINTVNQVAPTLLPRTPLAQLRVSRRCGFGLVDSLLLVHSKELGKTRTSIVRATICSARLS